MKTFDWKCEGCGVRIESPDRQKRCAFCKGTVRRVLAVSVGGRGFVPFRMRDLGHEPVLVTSVQDMERKAAERGLTIEGGGSTWSKVRAHQET